LDTPSCRCDGETKRGRFYSGRGLLCLLVRKSGLCRWGIHALDTVVRPVVLLRRIILFPEFHGVLTGAPLVVLADRLSCLLIDLGGLDDHLFALIK
jgi:hypothetical protein